MIAVGPGPSPRVKRWCFSCFCTRALPTSMSPKMTVCQSTEASSPSASADLVWKAGPVHRWFFEVDHLSTSACFRRTRCAIRWSWKPLQRNVFGFAEALHQNCLARRNDDELRFDVHARPTLLLCWNCLPVLPYVCDGGFSLVGHVDG